MKKLISFKNLKKGLHLLYIDNYFDFKFGKTNVAPVKLTIIEKRYGYADELDRSFLELKLTTKLLYQVKNEIKIIDKTFTPVEIITYYDGVFINFVHQIKDKLLGLIWWLHQDENSTNYITEPDKFRLKTVKSLINDESISKLLEEWDQGSLSGIGVCLRKRRHYHHSLSTLQKNDNFITAQSANLLLTEDMPGPNINKKKVKSYLKISLNSLKKDTLSKQKDTILLINENINLISLQLIKFFSIKYDIRKMKDTIHIFGKSSEKLDT